MAKASHLRKIDLPQEPPAIRERVLPGWRKKLSDRLTDLALAREPYFWIGFEMSISLAVMSGVAWGFRESGTGSLALSALFCILCSAVASGLDYFRKEYRFVARHFGPVGVAAWGAGLIASLGVQGYGVFDMSRACLFVAAVALLLSTQAMHWTFALYLRKYPKRFAVIGPQTGVTREILAFVQGRQSTPGVHRFYRFEGIVTGKRAIGVSDLLVTGKALGDPEIARFIVESLESGCNVSEEAAFYGDLFGRLPVEGTPQEWAFLLGHNTRPFFRDIAKRFFDVTMSALALTVLSPVMVAIACAVKLSSRGGVFFVQERQGRFGRPFRIFKFRTMSVSNENAPSRFTSQVDARVTRVGRVLRKIHFDELPQLLNIFMGDMSIVGPRPEMIHFARMMQHAIPVYQLRYIMRPGLSGLAQINQGYAGDNVKETLEKLSYDLYYIKNHSFWMDLMIIVRTIFFIWRDNTY